MKTEILAQPQGELFFLESQSFRQPWVWVLLVVGTIPVLVLFGWGMVSQLALGEPWGDRPMTDLGLLFSGSFSMLLTLGLLWLFWSARLTVAVHADGLFVRYAPFHRKSRRVLLEKVGAVQATTYSPLREYGGWGIRYGRRGKVYNMSGNRGVLLTFQHGRTLLLGSGQDEQLAAAIHRIWKPSQIDRA